MTPTETLDAAVRRIAREARSWWLGSSPADALRAEVERLTASRDAARAALAESAETIAALMAGLERSAASRDAAEQAIQRIGMTLGSSDEWASQEAMIADVERRVTEAALARPPATPEVTDAMVEAVQAEMRVQMGASCPDDITARIYARAFAQAALAAAPPAPVSLRIDASASAGDARWTLADLRAANIARQAAWCPDQVPDLSFRGNELAGEVGEACNVIKKLERERHGWRGSRSTSEQLAEELADVVICADLAALTAGVDLYAAVRAKFDATSAKVGLSHRLVAAAPPAPASADGEVLS